MSEYFSLGWDTGQGICFRGSGVSDRECVCYRQCDGKAGAAARVVGNGKGSLVEGGQFPGDAESQPEVRLAASGFVNAVKAVKDIRLAFLGNTAALILNL